MLGTSGAIKMLGRPQAAVAGFFFLGGVRGRELIHFSMTTQHSLFGMRNEISEIEGTNCVPLTVIFPRLTYN